VIDEILNGKYRLVRQMGAGGMGAVYEAEEVPGSRRVAVKVISTGDESRDRALVGRFHREAKATMSIDTDHIVRVFDTGNDAASGQPFMVMEYLVGEDLAQAFRRLGPLPPDTALRIVAQACFGLEKAHAARVVHRDIKPANLFLAEREGGGLIVKVLDFGIAKIKMDQANITDSKSLTRTGSMVGSPLYMSPEQARGSKSIDHRADIWSMGVVLYQALTGRTPNQDIEALGELIIAICSELPRPVQELAPWVSPELATIVHRALRFEPADRFQTADEMLAALMTLLPNGSELTAEMLTPITDEAREHKAALMPAVSAPSPRVTSSSRYSAGALDPALASTTAAPDFDALPPPGPMPSMPPPRPGSMAPPSPSTPPPTGKTNEGVATSRSGELAAASASSTGRTVAMGVIALLVAGGAAVGAYTVMGKTADPVGTSAPVVAPPIVTAAIATAAATATAAPPVAAPTGKTVRVAILPLDATVEVDGVKATAVGGMIEIAGSLGTVHRVHITRGADQITEDVAVTQQGAVPAKLELKTTEKKPSNKPLK
jgi:eukaryotic-like serine/threonine-protein kinase